jgi:hypothetical protein
MATTITTKEIEKIQDNFVKFTSLVQKIENPANKEKLLKLLNDQKDRIAVTPTATRLEYHGAYAGGLIQNNLQVTKLMSELNKVYESRLKTDSIILLGLFHNIGKIGNEKEDLYLQQESDWHRNKGMMFEFNSDLNRIPVSTRSLYWLNKYEVSLSEEEVYAISSLNNMVASDSVNAGEYFNAPLSAVVLQNAVRVIAIKGTGKKSVTE